MGLYSWIVFVVIFFISCIILHLHQGQKRALLPGELKKPPARRKNA